MPNFQRILTGIVAVVAGEVTFGCHFVDATLNIRVALIRITVAMRLIITIQWAIQFPSALLMNDGIDAITAAATTTFLLVE